MIGIEGTLDDFNAALKSLDDKLRTHDITIEIRAIGGFAMLCNRLRAGGCTMDVDTAAKDMSDEAHSGGRRREGLGRGL